MKMYCVELGDEHDQSRYVGTYELEGSLIKLNIKYYWSDYKRLIKKKTFWSKSEWEYGWEKTNRIIIIPQKSIRIIRPITLKEIKNDDY